MSTQAERLALVAAAERERLGAHLDQLQAKFESALDPAQLFDRYPVPILTTALVAGVVLGAVTQPAGAPSRSGLVPGRRRSVPRTGVLHDAGAKLRGALVGMIVARLAEAVLDIVTDRRDADADADADAVPRRAASRTRTPIVPAPSRDG